MIESDYSGKSADGIADVFGKMFRDTVVKNFSFGRTKFANFLTEALGPHFRKMTLDEVGNSYYVVEFDETTNSESKKELQMRIRFWSEKMKRVVERHLKTASLFQQKVV